MYLSLKINKEFTELIYCYKHNEWFYIDDEMYCCERENEILLQNEND